VSANAVVRARIDEHIKSEATVVLAAALGAIARAQGMAEIAQETGLNPKSLYRALSGEGNPELETFIKVVRALGLHLHASASA
jgi:probable addiction module antidote protein